MGTDLSLPGEPCEVLTFVETLLPPGVDTLRVGGIAYVTEVRSVADLPNGVNALCFRSTAFVRCAEK